MSWRGDLNEASGIEPVTEMIALRAPVVKMVSVIGNPIVDRTDEIESPGKMVLKNALLGLEFWSGRWSKALDLLTNHILSGPIMHLLPHLELWPQAIQISVEGPIMLQVVNARPGRGVKETGIKSYISLLPSPLGRSANAINYLQATACALDSVREILEKALRPLREDFLLTSLLRKELSQNTRAVTTSLKTVPLSLVRSPGS